MIECSDSKVTDLEYMNSGIPHVDEIRVTVEALVWHTATHTGGLKIYTQIFASLKHCHLQFQWTHLVSSYEILQWQHSLNWFGFEAVNGSGRDQWNRLICEFLFAENKTEAQNAT